MEIAILNTSGQETGRNVELNTEIYAVEPNDHAIYLDVKQILANKRQGTHKSKQRNEISGTTKKLKRQKGTGGSRKGNIRNPLYKGGGTVFGPKPHAYDFKLNRKVKDIAKISALSAKAKDNCIFVVEDVNFSAPKTSEFATILSNLKVDDKKSIFVLPEYNDAVYLSTRNIPNVLTTLLSDLNTYDMVHADVLVFTESAAKIFAEEDIEVTA